MINVSADLCFLEKRHVDSVVNIARSVSHDIMYNYVKTVIVRNLQRN